MRTLKLIFHFLQYDEPDYDGCPTKVISAPDFDKELLPHDPLQCMECAIPLIKAHRVGPSFSIESIEDGLTRSRSHTTDSMSSGTSSTIMSRQDSEQPTPVPKSPLVTARFKVGSVKSEDGREEERLKMVDDVEKRSKPQGQNNGKENVEEILKMNGKGGRSPCGSPLVRMKRIYSSEGDSGQAEVEKSSEIDGSKEDAKDSVDPTLAASEEVHSNGETRTNDQNSTNLPVPIESPPTLSEDGVVGSSSSGEAAISPQATADRLEVKKEGSDVTSSTSSSVSAREGGSGTGGEEASSSTQSSETKDVTAEVLINIVPSRYVRGGS